MCQEHISHTFTPAPAGQMLKSGQNEIVLFMLFTPPSDPTTSPSSSRDALLHTLVVSGYLSYCCLPVSLSAGRSPLTFDINKREMPLTGYFLFHRSFSVNPRDVLQENTQISPRSTNIQRQFNHLSSSF